MSSPTVNFIHLQAGYFSARIILGITQFIVSLALLSIIYIVSKGYIKTDKKDVNLQNLFRTIILAITVSSIFSLFMMIFENNFIINWDYDKLGLTTFLTSIDGICAFIWDLKILILLSILISYVVFIRY